MESPEEREPSGEKYLIAECGGCVAVSGGDENAECGYEEVEGIVINTQLLGGSGRLCR